MNVFTEQFFDKLYSCKRGRRLATVSLLSASLVALISPCQVLSQSFNGAGRINPYSPTGWSPNPNNYAGTPYAGNGIYGGFNRTAYPGSYYPGMGTGPVYPFGNPYINPVAAGNGFYNFVGGGVAANLWRAPSGYYYPWYRGGGFNQIIYVDQSQSQAQTVAQQPPLSSQFSDMGQYLDDSKKNGKLADNDYKSLKMRLTDIHSKERSLRIAGGGQLSDEYEAEIRQNLNDFSREMVERIKL
ncbi:MAG: hypothetical protein KGS72_15605 [Cyanobacteria bacterium REEB67]|nr:hypothetical protein [Cyanobacteria bacterium REEB67]